MIPRAVRTPKVKEFVNPPFWTCPDCANEGTFGVLMICDRHYVRRCINCWFDQSLPLPPLKKHIIYLDQFVISNMMKELDSANTRAPGFYRSLFEKLDRLSELQLIVCPDSPIQDHESVVDTRYEKIRAVFRQLSHGVSFRDPKTLLHADIMQSFRSWISGKPSEHGVDRHFALTKNPDVWQSEYRIDLNFTMPGLSQELKEAHGLVTNRLHQTCEEWRTERNFDFKDIFNNELAGSARLILQRYARYAAHFAAVSTGGAPFDDEACFAPREATLILRMLTELASSLLMWNERFERILEFFASEHFRAIPGIRIAALFWATIAREINSGRKPDRFPTAAMFNDIDAVSSYSPLCDVMFVDREISHLAKQRELRQELVGSAHFFSLRKNEKADFLAFLDAIENNASAEHLQMVEEVYGPDWPTPFVDILAGRK
jgi:hypothetical protein